MRWLDAIGLLSGVRSVRRRLDPDSEAMQFPSYARDVAGWVQQSGDPARYSSLALAIRSLEREAIAGSFAEVGVWRGTTSRFLMRCAPERRLHLFDTFEGFAQEDREPENRNDSRFQDTSEAMVRERLGASPNVLIHKGHFPGTAATLGDERFAFVLLDLDVHAPTLAGLQLFYPRLVAGGYCFVHDFNNPESHWACRRALTEFLADKPERLIELPDKWGSAVFRKA